MVKIEIKLTFDFRIFDFKFVDIYLFKFFLQAKIPIAYEKILKNVEKV